MTRRAQRARRSPPPLAARSRILAQRRIPIADVDPLRFGNPRDPTPASRAQLAGSIDVHGFVQSITVRQVGARFEIIHGHQRFADMRDAGEAEIEADIIDCPDDERARALAVALNAVAAGWKRDELGAWVQSFLDGGRDVAWISRATGLTAAEAPALSGYLEAAARQGREVASQAAPRPIGGSAPIERDGRKDELLALLAGAGGIRDLDVEPTDELRRRWGTERGQLWTVESAKGVGAHRLLIADCSDPAAVDRLMAGARAVLFHTDAPYGINYGEISKGRVRQKWGKGWKEVENDDLGDERLEAFLRATLAAWRPHLTVNAAHYLWHPPLALSRFFFAAALAEGLLVHRQIVWLKPKLALSRSGMYHWQHEVCLYGWRAGNRPPWYGDRSQTSLWRVGRDEDDGMHPMQKPVELFVRPLFNHTRSGEVVAEPFAGSGSQFCAAEHTGRLCYGTELDPGYASVVLERLFKRGLKPRLEGAGRRPRAAPNTGVP